MGVVKTEVIEEWFNGIVGAIGVVPMCVAILTERIGSFVEYLNKTWFLLRFFQLGEDRPKKVRWCLYPNRSEAGRELLDGVLTLCTATLLLLGEIFTAGDTGLG